MAKPRKFRSFTERQWQDHLPLFERWSERQKAVARMVLVSNDTCADAGKAYGISRQAAYQCSLQAQTKIEKAEGRKPVTVWINVEKEEEIKDYLEKLGCELIY